MCVQLSIYYLNHFIQYQMKCLLLVLLAHWNKRLYAFIEIVCGRLLYPELCNRYLSNKFAICAFFILNFNYFIVVCFV